MRDLHVIVLYLDVHNNAKTHGHDRNGSIMDTENGGRSQSW
jgi:hypothetical protein